MSKTNYLENLRYDFPASIVVFLVALPLCLGIALASGAPFFSGLIAGVVGGVVVGFLSNSHVSVSGPAAGMAAVVLAGISTLGAYDVFLVALVLAGIIQMIMGMMKVGTIGEYFPSGVIRGMLTAIGMIIIIKQIPYALGYDSAAFFDEEGGMGGIQSIATALDYLNPSVIIVFFISMAILTVWDIPAVKKRVGMVPAGLIVVVAGTLISELVFNQLANGWQIPSAHKVNIPVPENFAEFITLFTLPDFSALSNKSVYIVAVTLAVVASIETLLCIEAADRLDEQRRVTSTNRELLAQGTGNLISGLIGGLPVTSVIVRTSANVQAQARTKTSTILHGLFLLIASLSIPDLLNRIPLASLAAILIVVGYKLCHPSVFARTYEKGAGQFLPFIITVIAVVATDLLMGVAIGVGISLIMILRGNLKHGLVYNQVAQDHGTQFNIRLAEEVSFLNKAAIRHRLDEVPAESQLVIDASNTIHIDSDVLEIIHEFRDIKAKQRNISCTLKGFTQENSGRGV